MMARVRKSLDENEKGFTLVELLVVVIIIGILAAIAIPVYLGQQGKAMESAAKADLANAKTALVVKLVEEPTTSVGIPSEVATVLSGYSPSDTTDSVTIREYDSSNGTFCIEAETNDTTFKTTESGGISEDDCEA